MRRRDFVTLLGGAIAIFPGATHAQQSAKKWTIGYLGFGPASSWTSEVEALRNGLRDLGYVWGDLVGRMTATCGSIYAGALVRQNECRSLPGNSSHCGLT
jgi:hypothetical protein